MITSQDIKAAAKRMGADIVGIGSIDRWSTAPIQMDPKQIMPKAKSIIALGFRVLRGSLRGIEEGTYFSNYSAMGYGGITYLYMPMTVINLSKMIEDAGYEAVPMGHQSDWRAIDNSGYLRENYSRPVAPGKAAPDVMVNLRIAGFLCGLGEIGYSKMLLTPEFGPVFELVLLSPSWSWSPIPSSNRVRFATVAWLVCGNAPADVFLPTEPSRQTWAVTIWNGLMWIWNDATGYSKAEQNGKKGIRETFSPIPKAVEENTSRRKFHLLSKRPSTCITREKPFAVPRGAPVLV